MNLANQLEVNGSMYGYVNMFLMFFSKLKLVLQWDYVFMRVSISIRQPFGLSDYQKSIIVIIESKLS